MAFEPSITDPAPTQHTARHTFKGGLAVESAGGKQLEIDETGALVALPDSVTSTNTAASVLADIAPSLPLTITAGVNDTFIYTPASTGIPETFTLNPDTYTTLAELIAVLNGRSPDPYTYGVGSDQFSDFVLASDGSGKLLLASLAAGAVGNGDTITEGNGGAAALGFTANPDTFAGGLSAAVLASPAVGSRQAYTFTSEDLVDPASWWNLSPHRTEGPVKVWGQWTPEVSGPLQLLIPPLSQDGYEESYWLFQGEIANSDYPDATADSGSFTGQPIAVAGTGFVGAIDPTLPGSAYVSAGQVYTVILSDSSNGAGEAIDLAPLLNSLAPFGGLSGTPPPLPPQVGLFLSSTRKGPRWRPGPAAQADVLLNPRGTLSVVLHTSSAIYAETPHLDLPLTEALIAPARRSLAVVDIIQADGHVGPNLSLDSLGLAAGSITDWQFVVVRLDGTASINVSGSSGFNKQTFPTSPGPNPTYNVPSAMLNWAAPEAHTGTDLTADATNQWIHTTAGGALFIYTELILEVG